MTDGLKRKLSMPPWHIPYLEKHRIYDIFQEIARELVIQQPPDHVLFMKQILFQAAQSRDVARIVILSSPKVNGYEVATQIALITKHTVIGEMALQDCMDNRYPTATKIPKPQKLAKCLHYMLRSSLAYKTGWILVDCIKTAQEAKAVLQEGIIPTHVFHLIPPFSAPLDELLYCHVSEWWPEYRRNIMGVRDVFKNCLVEIFLKQRDLQEIVFECVELSKIRPEFGGPKKLRVLILGPRGCGRKTQAKMLSEHLDLVYVDFEYLLCQAWISQNELGNKLRACKDEVCFQSDLLCKVINQRILQNDCLQKGWVLTGFPYTVMDFRHLDCLDTPPNRVIFLECDLNLCRERLVHRSMNVYTGSVLNFEENAELALGKALATHPKDKTAIIDAELNYYCENYGPLRNYCGETATVINGNQPQRWVYECIAAALVRPAPSCNPRNPCSVGVEGVDIKDNDLDTNTTSPVSSPV